MINEFWLLLLPIAAVSGWLTASTVRSSEQHKRNKNNLFPNHYLLGVNFLLNEEPDKAIDVFSKMLTVDSETIEIHLALGNLFRRRGEVDRAVRIHQNLIARPTLNRLYRAQALLALAMDYLSAGVLDRSERLFLELIDLKEHVATSLKCLLNIYEQENEWQKAIHIANQLKVYSDDDLSSIVSHYYCELAEISIKEHRFDQAKKLLDRALSINTFCVRASLLLAEMKIALGQYKHAKYYLQSIKTQNPDFLSETLAPLVRVYRALDKEEDLIVYLQDVLKEFPSISVAVVLSKQLRKLRDEHVAADFFTDYVRKYPSVWGLHQLIGLHLSSVDGEAKEDLTLLHRLTQSLSDERLPYRCAHCGFISKKLHWQCPTCKKWDMVKPVYVLEKGV
jgi:lipopolysaccharide biosynthesis regulator YciM